MRAISIGFCLFVLFSQALTLAAGGAEINRSAFDEPGTALSSLNLRSEGFQRGSSRQGLPPRAFQLTESPVLCWVRHYPEAPGPMEYAHRNQGISGPGDGAWDIAVDAAGNVYVTGASVSENLLDYVTIKYDRNGAEKWVARYNGLANRSDIARAIEIDGSGNVYVTGCICENIDLDWDFGTIKYNAGGGIQWAALYNGPGDDWDEAIDIAVDGAGNVYVTGFSVGTTYDYATIKYSPQGGRIWVARYDGPAHAVDRAVGIVVDLVGNVYVTGSSWGAPGDYDFATVKYNTNGELQWAARYGGEGQDLASAIAIDDSGNVYVTGTGRSDATGDDFVTLKYSSEGVLQWVARYDGPVHGIDQANDICLDVTGNVYVCGTSFDISTGFDLIVVKYDASGEEEWVARYNRSADGDDRGNAIAIDQAGNVYVTGEAWGGRTRNDCVIVKYDPSGQLVWVTSYHDRQGAGDYARAIAVDSAANVYITGAMDCWDWSFYTTIKYSQQPVLAAPGPIVECEVVDMGMDKRRDRLDDMRVDCYPNPAHDAVTIAFTIPSEGIVNLTLYDIQGREVARLIDGKKPAGKHQVELGTLGLAPGIYLSRLEFDSEVLTRKIVLLK